MAEKKAGVRDMVSRSPLKIIAAAFIFTIFAQLVHTIFSLLGMAYYTNPDYFSVWSPLMMSLGAPSPDFNFFYMSVGFGFIGAILFVIAYSILGKGLSGNPAKRGRDFGILIFLVSSIPSSFSMLLLINVPWGIVIMWTFENLVVYLIGGAITGQIMIPSTKKEAQLKGPYTPKGGGDEGMPDWMKQGAKKQIQKE